MKTDVLDYLPEDVKEAFIKFAEYLNQGNNAVFYNGKIHLVSGHCDRGIKLLHIDTRIPYRVVKGVGGELFNE